MIRDLSAQFEKMGIEKSSSVGGLEVSSPAVLQPLVAPTNHTTPSPRGP